MQRKNHKKTNSKNNHKTKTANNSRRKQSSHTFEGNIRVNQKGVGYIDDPKTEESIEIEPMDLKTALNGDLVRVVHHGRQGSRVYGEVLEVLERKTNRFVGTVDRDKDTKVCFIVPDDRRMYVDILIPSPEDKNLKVGDKVFVEMLSWEDPHKSPRGKVIKVLGKKGDHETEIASVLYGHGFELNFPKEVEKEAEKLVKDFSKTLKSEETKRRDFREITTFTIDPKTAKDFDDAISVKELPGGLHEIGIHIADVSFYVRHGTALDKEARKRTTSVYMVDRTIPMLPEELSNNICSLNPNEDRLAYSAVFTVDKNGEVKDEWFGRTIINSDKRFTYREAQEVLDGKNNGPFKKELEILEGLAKKYKEKRIKEGSVRFDREEIEVVLNEKSEPIEIRAKEHYFTMNMIEEFMLLANRRVAAFASKKIGQKKFLGFVYRIHDKPNRERIMLLSDFVKGIGFDLADKDGNVRGQAINKLLADVSGKDIEDVVQMAVLRSMQKAVYTTKNVGHFGLAFEDYTHFTSPIRRYPDILVHRLMSMILAGKQISRQVLMEYEVLLERSSQKEKEAEQAERDSVRYKQLEYMEDKVGKTFEGIVSGITPWGIYVEEDRTKTNGMIKLGTIGDDYYEFNEKKYELVGSRTGHKIRLGDKVRVKLISVNTEARMVDFKLLKVLD